MLRLCTLTGAGTDTDLLRISELGKLHPFSEWALLYSPSRAGTENRYPERDWVLRTGQFLRTLGIHRALHLCGAAVPSLINGCPTTSKLVEPFERVQLNLRADRIPVQMLHELGERIRRAHPHLRLIVQMNRLNASLCRHLAGIEPFEFLFDDSGGRGLERSSWPGLDDGAEHGLSAAPCGFAGGLGPDNLEAQWPAMSAAAGNKPFWIDMEGKLRDAGDRFDLDRCEDVLNAVGLLAGPPG